mgnify:FL=1
MQEQLIKFETAKLAKEKGFNEDCISGFINDDSLIKYHVRGEYLKEWSNYTGIGFTFLRNAKSFLIPFHEIWYKAPA